MCMLSVECRVSLMVEIIGMEPSQVMITVTPIVGCLRLFHEHGQQNARFSSDCRDSDSDTQLSQRCAEKFQPRYLRR